MDVFGATVRGPSHASSGERNQDAWAHGRVRTMRVVVVSDGMGSRPYARDGAHAACKAVVDAVRQWCRHPAAPLDVLLGLVHLLWRARVAPREPRDCACTCLFAALEPDGSGVAAQLGDGLVLVREPHGVHSLSSRSEDSFANETAALGVTARIGAWRHRRFDKGSKTLVLCTDGVADDLLPDRLPEFVDWLVDEVQEDGPSKRRYRLARALRDWPTPKHLDDKTIAVIHVPEVCA